MWFGCFPFTTTVTPPAVTPDSTYSNRSFCNGFVIRDDPLAINQCSTPVVFLPRPRYLNSFREKPAISGSGLGLSLLNHRAHPLLLQPTWSRASSYLFTAPSPSIDLDHTGFRVSCPATKPYQTVIPSPPSYRLSLPRNSKSLTH